MYFSYLGTGDRCLLAALVFAGVAFILAQTTLGIIISYLQFNPNRECASKTCDNTVQPQEDASTL